MLWTMPALIFSRSAGVARRFRSASCPPSSAHCGTSEYSPVLDAVYGYWSSVTSTPRARASSTSASVSTAPAPVLRADDLVMRDLRRQMPFLADADDLANAVEHLCGLVAHVRGVDAAEPADHGRKFDDLFGRRVTARDVEETGRRAERAVFHRLLGERLHPLDLLNRGASGWRDRPPAGGCCPDRRASRRLIEIGVLAMRSRNGATGSGSRRPPLENRRDAFAQVVLRGRRRDKPPGPG